MPPHNPYVASFSSLLSAHTTPEASIIHAIMPHARAVMHLYLLQLRLGGCCHTSDSEVSLAMFC